MAFKELLKKNVQNIFWFSLGCPLSIVYLICILIRYFPTLILECLFLLIGDNRFSHWLSGKIYPILNLLTHVLDNVKGNCKNWMSGFLNKIPKIVDIISEFLTNNIYKKIHKDVYIDKIDIHILD